MSRFKFEDPFLALVSLAVAVTMAVWVHSVRPNRAKAVNKPTIGKPMPARK
jgi:hypothetical protein